MQGVRGINSSNGPRGVDGLRGAAVKCNNNGTTRHQPKPHVERSSTSTLTLLCVYRKNNTRALIRHQQHSYRKVLISNMKRASWFALIVVAVNTCLPAFSIDTVPTLDVEKYIGRWYQVRKIGYCSSSRLVVEDVDIIKGQRFWFA